MLAEARTIIGYFHTGFIFLVIFILLLVAGIILIYREVRGASRELGIIFLSYGTLEYLMIVIGKYSMNAVINTAEMPETIRNWLPGFAAAVLHPLEIYSIVLAVFGLALIVLSVIYRRRPVQVLPPA